MAKDGLVLFFPSLIVTIIVWGFWIIGSQFSLLLIGIFTGLLTLFLAFFFRDPDRQIPQIEGALVSPADGFISAIKQLDTHPFVNSAAIQISIFLTVFDVHVNRVPVSGVIDEITYKAGSFKSAHKDIASAENEQTSISMTTTSGAKIVFKQIAGFLARRIVCRLEKGQTVQTGQRFGMIKFGSRADVIVPADTKIDIKKGQHVKGGFTIIGRLSVAKNSSTERLPSEQNNA